MHAAAPCRSLRSSVVRLPHGGVVLLLAQASLAAGPGGAGAGKRHAGGQASKPAAAVSELDAAAGQPPSVPVDGAPLDAQPAPPKRPPAAPGSNAGAAAGGGGGARAAAGAKPRGRVGGLAAAARPPGDATLSAIQLLREFDT